MNLIHLFLSIIHIQLVINDSINGIRIQIFDNIAEISQPIIPYDLPIIYSQQEWSDIRPDSIRLVGNGVDIRAQIIAFNHTSLNGQKIMIQRSVKNDTYTEGIMIDETQNLVEDLVDNTFYTITSDRIRYLSIPPIRNYSVDFVLDTNINEQLYLRYLQNNIRWEVRYDLLLENNNTDSILQAYANIQNDGKSSLMIDFAELISGDVNIQSASSPLEYYDGNGASDGDISQQGFFGATSTPAPSISEASELAGVYIFSINETFILDPRSSYILPMFRPIIDIERYGSVDKYFSSIDNRGNAQRAYRFRVAETFLPQGKVFVRESDRLVGESYWSDIAANETNEFTLGQDPELQYMECVKLNSRRYFNESVKYSYMLSTYTINIRLINNKQRPINFEYRLRFSSQDYLSLKENTTDSLFQLEGPSIFAIFELNENDDQQFKFTFEAQ